jgi:glycosyltransferase involved in cell wall biosynthesis
MMQRIAVIAARPVSGEQGGAERFYEGLVSALNAHGAQAEMINVINDESCFAAIEETCLRYYDLDLSAYDGVISTKAPGYLVRHPNHVCYLQHTMRVFYDMFEREFHQPVEELIQQRRLIQEMDSAALRYPRTKKVFVIGNEVRNRLLKYINVDSEVLYQAAAFNGFRSGSYEYIFLPGRLHRWKRVDLIIEAMKYLERPLTLKIAGRGEDEAKFRELAKGDKRIEFLGRVSDEKLIDLYANALVVPFVPEGEDFGLVTLEAFNSCKPVITCSDSGEPSYIVSDGESGFIVPPDPKMIASKLEYLYDYPEKAKEMGERGMESIRHITWENVAEKLLSALGMEQSSKKKSIVRFDEASYIRAFDQIEGWLSSAGAQSFRMLNKIQKRSGIKGDIFEIGVHHGKSAILLSFFIDFGNALLRLNDIFENQDLNISRSGTGNEDIFLRNLSKYHPGFGDYIIYKKPSNNLTIEDTGSNVRIFHIDGGHSAKETETDLYIALKAITSDGAIIIDDYFNQDYPGVSEGVNKFLIANDELKPFMLCFNKMFICRKDAWEKYVNQIFDKQLMKEFNFEYRVTEFYQKGVLILSDIPALKPMKINIILSSNQIICKADENVTVNIQVENTGDTDITDVRGGNGLKLSYHIFKDGKLFKWDNDRLGLWPLAKGENKSVQFRFSAPQSSGEYVYEFDGVIDNIAWLKDHGGNTSYLKVTVVD